MIEFELRQGLDVADLAARFRESGRLQILDFLAADPARKLYDVLAASPDWKLAINKGEEILHFDEAAIAAWPPERQATLNRAVAMGGRYGFQFRYETIRLPKESDNTGSEAIAALQELTHFLSAPEMVAFMRTLTGAADIAFADAHASRYKPGHFLTTHDDKSDTMGRRAAYVLNLTPKWRPDWGGMLLFYDNLGNVIRGFTPGFNTLNIFRVPQAHSVSWVTPLAGQPRYAVTGWLRAES